MPDQALQESLDFLVGHLFEAVFVLKVIIQKFWQGVGCRSSFFIRNIGEDLLLEDLVDLLKAALRGDRRRFFLGIFR